jgi:hypothetical protein
MKKQCSKRILDHCFDNATQTHFRRDQENSDIATQIAPSTRMIKLDGNAIVYQLPD